MTLYFFERITDDDFVGPVVVAAPSEDDGWTVLAARERSPRADLEALGWQIAQDLAAMPAHAAVVYPSHYRRAVVG